MNRRNFLNIPFKKFKTISQVSGDSNNISGHKAEKTPSINSSVLASDFTDNMLFFEIMKLGMDPANLSREQMLDIVFSKLQKPNNKNEVEIKND